ncbi:ATP-binding protein [Advenella kashmirensis]
MAAAPVQFPQLQNFASKIRLSLFSRSFFLLAALLAVSLTCWLIVFFNMQEEPRASQMAERGITALKITRKSLAYVPPNDRNALVIDLATTGDIQVFPRQLDDVLQPLPDTTFWRIFADKIQRSDTQTVTKIASSMNGEPGIWISFNVGDELYWLLLKSSTDNLPQMREWIGWGVIALLLALIGAAISVRFVNTPLSRLAKAAQQVARGENPAPLPDDQGPLEIRELNNAFNRMARDIRQTEADRELMLAGISHDLRTPLARMRLEIELSNVSDETRSAIDEDLGQIDHSIGQLMEYARPAGVLPDKAINISSILRDITDREKAHTESLGGTLRTMIQPNLYARIGELNLKRIVSNLIENSRRYGRSVADGQPHILVRAREKGSMIEIDVCDNGAGINAKDTERLLRPFSRGEAARTGVSGAGLGLSIVERLLQHVGGTLKLLPNQPTGLIGHIEIPKARDRNYQLDSQY